MRLLLYPRNVRVIDWSFLHTSLHAFLCTCYKSSMKLGTLYGARYDATLFDFNPLFLHTEASIS